MFGSRDIVTILSMRDDISSFVPSTYFLSLIHILKGSDFKGVVYYILNDEKGTQIIDADGLFLENNDTIVQGFIAVSDTHLGQLPEREQVTESNEKKSSPFSLHSYSAFCLSRNAYMAVSYTHLFHLISAVCLAFQHGIQFSFNHLLA